MSRSRIEALRRDPGFVALFALARRRLVLRHQVVIEEGGAPGTLFLLEAGLATVRATGPQGSELLLSHVYPGEFFGEMCLFPRQGARSAMVRAASDASVLELPYAGFVELTRRYPGLWLELAGQLAERLRAVNHRLASLPMLQAAERIWDVIREMARNSDDAGTGDEIAIRLRREDLGKLAGCSRELAGAILHELAGQGRLRLSGHTLLIRRSALAEPDDPPQTPPAQTRPA